MSWSWWKKAETALSHFLASPGGLVVRGALAGAIQVGGQIGLSLLMQMAQSKIGELEERPIPSEMKGEEARKYLRDYAARLGLKVSTSLINFAVEAAVQALRARQAPEE